MIWRENKWILELKVSKSMKNTFLKLSILFFLFFKSSKFIYPLFPRGARGNSVKYIPLYQISRKSTKFYQLKHTSLRMVFPIHISTFFTCILVTMRKMSVFCDSLRVAWKCDSLKPPPPWDDSVILKRYRKGKF